MLEGSIGGGEVMTGFAPPRVEVTKPPQNFTPLNTEHFSNQTQLPKYKSSIVTEAPKDGAVTTTEVPQFSDWNEADIKRFMNKLETEGTLPKKAEAINEVEKKIPQEKKTKGFFEKIREWFRNLFR